MILSPRFFLRSRLFDVVLLVCLVVGVGAFSHYWIADRAALTRAVYPIEAAIARVNMRCSEGVPVWLESITQYAIDEQYSLANQVAYIDPQNHLHHCESGWQGDLLSSPPVSAEARFRFASLTKLVTAAAVLDRVNAGELSLDMHLLDLFPELRPVADERLEQITIAHLLTHSAGFDRLRQSDSVTQRNVRPWCPYDLAKLAKLHLEFEPGARYSYSNIGYCLLGAALERTLHKSFRSIAEDRYGLSARGIKFVDGPYLSDEIHYDFRNIEFFDEDYYRDFDFVALSSSMGLSGNAVALTKLLKEISYQHPFTLTSIKPKEDCDISQYHSCFGAAVSLYQEHGGSPTLYLQPGYMFGVTTLAFFDNRGGVFVWLGGGASMQSFQTTETMVKLAYSLQAAASVGGD